LLASSSGGAAFRCCNGERRRLQRKQQLQRSAALSSLPHRYLRAIHVRWSTGWHLELLHPVCAGLYASPREIAGYFLTGHSLLSDWRFACPPLWVRSAQPGDGNLQRYQCWPSRSWVIRAGFGQDSGRSSYRASSCPLCIQQSSHLALKASAKTPRSLLPSSSWRLSVAQFSRYHGFHLATDRKYC